MRSHGLFYKTIGFPAAIQNDVQTLLTDFAVDTKDPVSLSPELLFANFCSKSHLNFQFAGTVMFVTYVLGLHPDIQEKILAEVALVYPSNQPINYRNIKDLVYTEAFFKEVLRLYPVAAFVARVASEDTMLGEYLLKPGVSCDKNITISAYTLIFLPLSFTLAFQTMIMYSTYVAHRDPRYFSEPLKILPERWINKDDNSGIRCDATAFAPFGLKARTCLGQHLASSIFILYIANVSNITLVEFPNLAL